MSIVPPLTSFDVPFPTTPSDVDSPPEHRARAHHHHSACCLFSRATLESFSLVSQSALLAKKLAMDALTTLLARANENGNCTKATCPVIYSVYGYRPSLAATLVFLILFGISSGIYLFQGIKTKTWFFSMAMVIGGLSEVMGYVAKLLLYNDPFSDTGFKMSVVLLTFAPAFYAAGIYFSERQHSIVNVHMLTAEQRSSISASPSAQI